MVEATYGIKRKKEWVLFVVWVLNVFVLYVCIRSVCAYETWVGLIYHFSLSKSRVYNLTYQVTLNHPFSLNTKYIVISIVLKGYK